jgi:hypothetical protein
MQNKEADIKYMRYLKKNLEEQTEGKKKIGANFFKKLVLALDSRPKMSWEPSMQR